MKVIADIGKLNHGNFTKSTDAQCT